LLEYVLALLISLSGISKASDQGQSWPRLRVKDDEEFSRLDPSLLDLLKFSIETEDEIFRPSWEIKQSKFWNCSTRN